MKKSLMVMGLMAACAWQASAQSKPGVVVYERKTNVHLRLPPEAEQMKAMIPEFQISKMELLYNETSSLFRRVKEEEPELPTAGSDGPRFSFRMGGMGGDAETYRNYTNLLTVTSQELGPKKYLVDDTLKPIKWKLEADTMTIAGYLCTKATTSILAPQRMGIRSVTIGADGTQKKDSTVAAPKATYNTVVAWFAEGIESQGGPENFYGLPGLILKVDIDNGWMVYTPISLSPLGNNKIEPPTAGKKITREELRKMQMEQMRSLGNGMRQGGPIRMQ
ncbi:MAG: GLPGLI family protein [Bacteroidetes bacterium]|nr:MAG: GLPGLI family protein [Bacteroidota bacterium]